MLDKLEAFCRGEEDAASIGHWARALWRMGDDVQVGPLPTNGVATAILSNLYGASDKADPDDPESGPMLRRADALDYMRDVRCGWTRRVLQRPLVSVALPMATLCQRLGQAPVRHMIDGIGWFEIVQFASLGSGRVFGMRSDLGKHIDSPEAYHPAIMTEESGTAFDCLVDLLETLCIDLTDLSWVAEEFAELALPEWTVFRQDDNGNRAAVATFSGRQKARAAMAKLEVGAHKQTYWLESTGR